MRNERSAAQAHGLASVSESDPCVSSDPFGVEKHSGLFFGASATVASIEVVFDLDQHAENSSQHDGHGSTADGAIEPRKTVSTAVYKQFSEHINSEGKSSGFFRTTSESVSSVAQHSSQVRLKVNGLSMSVAVEDENFMTR